VRRPKTPETFLPDPVPATAVASLGGAGSPILVEVLRGGTVESVHRGAALVVDRGARVHARWGDTARSVFPRSAIKSLQAIPLIETGAAAAFGLGPEEIALACASHNGEPTHTGRIAAWLETIGLGIKALECGVHAPYAETVAADLVRRGVPPSVLHNNCSGKHAGFLTTAVHLGEPTAGYTRYDHPVQQRVLGTLEQMCGLDLGAAPWGIDGCSIPTVAVPLEGLAFAMARIADPADLPERRRDAVLRIRAAWAAHPYLVGGADRFDSEMIRAGHGRFVTKVGAEGVFCAALPDDGLGVALKIDDGAERAANTAMAAILRQIGALDEAEAEAVGRWERPAIRSRRGDAVGAVQPAPVLCACGADR
jgi:L-asparaginase II